MNTRIIIVGQGASGKDHLKKRFVDKGFIPSVSYTTRPMRDGEIDGIHYKFVTKEVFMFMVETDQFYEWQEFGGEDQLDAFYGTTKEEFNRADVFIMTPYALNEIPKAIVETSLIIYLNIDEKIRRERLSKRKDFDTVENRIRRDNEQFKDFSNFDIEIKNNNF